ncbi:MAG: hypothetical protein MUO73_05265 [Thermoplasmata archaeon]|nr:hypothetical protein [Thermoplasmata archaeon]
MPIGSGVYRHIHWSVLDVLGDGVLMRLMKAFSIIIIFIAIAICGLVLLDNAMESHELDASKFIESHSGMDITPELKNASSDYGRECTVNDRYSEWTRYICIYNITQSISEAEYGRGATSKTWEYFLYSFIYDNKSIHLEPNRLYLIRYDLHLGYCSGAGKITSAKKIMNSCNECTQEPSGIRPMGCCKEVGCISSDGSGRVH